MTTLSTSAVHASAEPALVKLWRHETSNIAEIEVNKAAVERFNQSQQRWKIEVEMIPEGSYTETVSAAALAGDLPCVLDMDQPVVPNFAWSGYLRPLKGLVSQEVLDSLIDSAKGTYKDDVYSIGQFEVALALFSRQSILKEHGIRIGTIEQPWTKEELLRALATLKASGKYAYPLEMRTGWKGEWYSYGYAPMLQSFGADQIDRSTYRTAEGLLNGKQAVAWGEFFQSLFAEGYVDRNPSDDKAFSQQRAALDYVGSWEMANHVTSFGDDLVVMPVPDFGSGPVVGGGSWHWGITQGCANPEGAAAFLDYILQPNEIAAMSEATGMIPSTPAAAELTEHYRTGGDWRFFYDYSAAYARLRPATPAYPIISSTFETMARNIKDGADVQDSLDQAVDTIERNISDNKGYGFN
ncbi:sugar ABC transporter substrate-binding protein [Marinobacterium sedimentorum]|uniref:sugar ABC transporter substrate-binding protein n=1 Tax=Marinobacterium sedimentorum TaxID=2927804 RepID=UPI0020C6B804|nr:extracellular solute-binding protein [Marinobacterium sedimentorum]MCP8686720.1 extracellular solute-binding protein [Marinobacterium sedimentorum]